MFIKLIFQLIISNYVQRFKSLYDPQADLKKIIRKIHVLLSFYKDDRAQHWFEYFNNINNNLQNIHDIKKIAQELVLVFQDPNNFDDLELFRANKFVKRDNKRLQKLRIKLFKWCENFLDEGLMFDDVCEELITRPYGSYMIDIVGMIYNILQCGGTWFRLGWSIPYHTIYRRCMIGYSCKDICLLVLEIFDNQEKNLDECILLSWHTLTPQEI